METTPLNPKRTVQFLTPISCIAATPSQTSIGLQALCTPASTPTDQQRFQLIHALKQTDTRAEVCHSLCKGCIVVLSVLMVIAFVLAIFSPIFAKHSEMLGYSASEIYDSLANFHSEYGLYCNETGCVMPDPDHHDLQHRKRSLSDSKRGCSTLKVTNVWNVSFPKLLTESAIRLIDINDDGVDDVISGFATGGDGYNVPEIVCDIYFDGQHPCFGGVMALDGRDGRLIWKENTEHEVFALNCNADLNLDGIKDCVAGGRAGVLLAINSRNGVRLWTFPVAKDDLSNFYTPQIIADIDDDGISDILVSHGGDPLRVPTQPVTRPGIMLLLSGKMGTVLQKVTMPDGGETYYSPQIYSPCEGETLVLFGTGGENHGGHLYVIEMKQLLAGNINTAVAILSDPFKGIMVPPVLADISNDNIPDIIVAMFNSTVVAIDGAKYKVLWTYVTANGETYSTPAAGYYNEDNVPDFFIKYSVGAGYPVYYYAESVILDGRTGKPLLSPPIRDVIGSQSSPLTISLQDDTDMFLYWLSDCDSAQGSDTYTFTKDTRVHQKSRADFCRLRFNSQGYTRMYAISQRTRPPGVVIYDSRDVADLERNVLVDTVAMGKGFLRKNPDWLQNGSRSRRHVGAHDEGGIQRLISTGSLAEPLPGTEKGQIDLVFATYLFYPTKTNVILPEDVECVKRRTANINHGDKINRERLEAECVYQRTGQPAEESESYRDLFGLKMGAMTIYRKRLQCSPGGAILPAKQQSWAAYMGTLGNSLFMPRYRRFT